MQFDQTSHALGVLLEVGACAHAKRPRHLLP